MSFNLLDIIFTKVYPAVLVLFFFGLTIFIHELGHFLVARRCKMVVERFFVGFGPRIFSWTRDGVEYGIAWLPFGGYVALPQMSPMETIEGKTENTAETLPPVTPGSKIKVALAGPFMNLILAIVLATIIWQVGLSVPVNPSIVGWVEPGSREEQDGILPGDRIVKVNDADVKTWMDVQRMVAISLEPTVTVTFDRKGAIFQKTLETEMNKYFSIKTINLFSQARPKAAGFLDDSPAEKAGIKAGDRFMAVQGMPVNTVAELRDLLGKRPDLPTEIKVMRDGRNMTFTVVPRLGLDPTEKVKAGRIGVKLEDDLEYEVQRPGPTPVAQFHDILELMGDTIFALMHSKQTGVGAKSLSGPVGIAGGWWHEIVHGGWRRGLWFAVMLNINLAIINLLPLPVLDGGHILFSLVESVRRKPLNARFIQATSTTFAVLLIGFMLYVTKNDIERLVGVNLRSNHPAPISNDSGSGTESNQP